VHDVKGVQKSYAYDDLLCNFGCIIFVQENVVLHKLEEIFALDKLGNDVEMAFGLDTLLEF
jgi:hypothetical protein